MTGEAGTLLLPFYLLARAWRGPVTGDRRQRRSRGGSIPRLLPPPARRRRRCRRRLQHRGAERRVVAGTLVSIRHHQPGWTTASTGVIDPGNLQLRVRASDAADGGDIVEGGIDNVTVCPTTHSGKHPSVGRRCASPGVGGKPAALGATDLHHPTPAARTRCGRPRPTAQAAARGAEAPDRRPARSCTGRGRPRPSEDSRRTRCSRPRPSAGKELHRARQTSALRRQPPHAVQQPPTLRRQATARGAIDRGRMREPAARRATATD